jgi:endonuclease III
VTVVRLAGSRSRFPAPRPGSRPPGIHCSRCPLWTTPIRCPAIQWAFHAHSLHGHRHPEREFSCKSATPVRLIADRGFRRRVPLPRGARQRAPVILERFKDTYPPRYCFLEGQDDPFQLLVAVVLSAQCTDEQVNKVTPGLFAKYPTPRALAEAPRGDVERLIYSTGFYRAKARHIQELAADLVERFDGVVPGTMAELTSLAGVGRKTANVIQSYCFDRTEGVCVDTHVKRVAYRLGLTREEDPVKVEKDLMRVFDQADWPDVTYYLISHGRAVCPARSPACGRCPVADVCPKRGVAASPRKKKATAR